MLTCREAIEYHVADIQTAEEARARAAGSKPLAMHPFGDSGSELPLMEAVALCTKVVWDSIGEVVVAARDGMAMIQGIAKAAAARNKPLTWTTPTGFIVEQAIYKDEAYQVRTQLFGGMRLQLNKPSDKLDMRKMKSSAAPNFVHSMDASHLIRSVNGFAEAGIGSIAVIHDSFGTHAGRADTLRAVLRREFVELYTEDRLEEFKTEVEDTILEEIDIPVPMVGTLDLLSVLRSDYCFS
nr:T3/T7-like RNA polymerase [Virgibacillus halodenitrificans]